MQHFVLTVPIKKCNQTLLLILFWKVSVCSVFSLAMNTFSTFLCFYFPFFIFLPFIFIYIYINITLVFLFQIFAGFFLDHLKHLFVSDTKWYCQSWKKMRLSSASVLLTLTAIYGAKSVFLHSSGISWWSYCYNSHGEHI